MNECKVYLAQIPQGFNSILLGQFLQFVSEEKAKKISSFVFMQDKLRSLFAELLLRCVIINQLKINNSVIQFGYNKHCKPYLINHNNFKFNISHSGEWVACAVAESEIGVDIEQVKPADQLTAKHFFSTQEYEWFTAKPPEQQDDAFFTLWTHKESYVKAIGTGLYTEPKSYTILPDSSDKFALKTDEKLEYFFHQYSFNSGYKLAVCSMNNKFCKEPFILSAQQIVEFFANI